MTFLLIVGAFAGAVGIAVLLILLVSWSYAREFREGAERAAVCSNHVLFQEIIVKCETCRTHKMIRIPYEPH